MGKILVELEGKEREVEFKGKRIRVDRLLDLLNIYPETAVVVKGKELLCDDDLLSDGERVKVVVATSKG
ncbi:sulfur carrier protein [Thermovibrio guaymasensis]|uniref:Sulfur carrier protein n=1 Tax=Thermovibrio guaymasensis TaxID=240167 RepID=A0A420W780_9BACT|nr:thiamine biosynthesis protein ThiS [Thermovibrio guaymasensis]RKQ63153.1 sulfur carrier protein [Thermovibrio guaymasensis]